MNFVADAGISPRTVKFLLEQGHDVVHVRDIGMQRANDTEILELARSQDRIVLTFDLDFGDLLALGLKDKPSTIIFRLDDETADSVNTNLLTVLAQTESELRDGALFSCKNFATEYGTYPSFQHNKSIQAFRRLNVRDDPGAKC
jgi:predicted nuclease of predicted toxin-antitoxin system